MLSLAEMQRRFVAATLFGDATAVAELDIVANGLAPAARIAIYRDNVLGNYRNALGATFPVVKALVGAVFFDTAVEHFARSDASTEGDINGYGAAFPAFLERYAPAIELAYLPDVARLEWAVDRSHAAADAAPLDTHALAKVAPGQLAGLRFTLHPSARLVASPYPIFRIWQVNQPDCPGDQSVSLDEEGAALLVQRGDRGVRIEPLSEGDARFLAALAAGCPLADAAASASHDDPAFELGDSLRRYVAHHALVDFSVSGDRPSGS